MKIKKEVKFSYVKGKENFENMEEVHCDGKSLFNKILFVLSLIFTLVCLVMLLGSIDFSKFNITFTNMISIIATIIIFCVPSMYFLLKLININLNISKDKIIYKNILGNKYEYPFRDIESAVYYPSIGETTSDSIVIKLKDKKKIKITNSERNFRMLKAFLNSLNILK